MKIGKPAAAEFSQYHETFISCVPDGQVEDMLESQIQEFPSFVASIPSDQIQILHEPYGWSIHQVIEHIVDAERVFGYRALRFSTGDTTELPGWNENEFAAQDYGSNVSVDGLASEFASLRRANVCLLKRIDTSRLQKIGLADGRSFSVRAIAYLMVGHLLHHQRILQLRLGS